MNSFLFLFQGEQGVSECMQSLQTLFSVLYTMTRMMAPYTPFLTEHMFQNLRHLLPWTLTNENASIHYIMLPKPRYMSCALYCVPRHIAKFFCFFRPLLS